MKRTIAILAICLFGFLGVTQAFAIRTVGAAEITPLMATPQSGDVQPQN